jgi:hypothetical protein
MDGQLEVLWCQQVIDVLIVQLQQQAADMKQSSIACSSESTRGS